MAIYTRFGTAVELTEACFSPIWIERRSGEIKRHFTKPKRTKRTLEIEETVGLFVRVKVVDQRQDHGPSGRMLYDGKWMDLIHLVADDGIRELHNKFGQMIGADELAKFESWNKKDGPEATALWPIMNMKEAA